VYRADLNHPVSIAEHGNAVGLDPAGNRADLTVSRVRRHSLGMTEKAKASGNALDKPTSVGSEMARKYAEPIRTEKANDDRRQSVAASWRWRSKGHSGLRPPISIAKRVEAQMRLAHWPTRGSAQKAC
jgi:hypothetical protein